MLARVAAAAEEAGRQAGTAAQAREAEVRRWRDGTARPLLATGVAARLDERSGEKEEEEHGGIHGEGLC